MTLFQGQALRLERLDDGFAELVLDLDGCSVNKLDRTTLAELRAAVEVLEQTALRGLLVRSAKPAFMVGADVTEFPELFEAGEAAMYAWIEQTLETFGRLETLPYPCVSAVNGLALGGGLELALATDYRVLAEDARVGLPEVTLGICPGFGGTVRLSRLIGVTGALDWLLEGKPRKASAALVDGAADCMVAPQSLREEALALLREAAEADDWQAQRARKRHPVAVPDGIATRGDTLDALYPAPRAILAALQAHAGLAWAEALRVESEAFVGLARGPEAASLVGLFLADQAVRKQARRYAEGAAPVRRAAVLGAGIMGGGIAYQAAASGTPILMKDIRAEALELGMRTATAQLDRQIAKGKLSETQKSAILERITPTLEWEGFAETDLVVEAVVERADVKAAVLGEAEVLLAADAVLASNTSTISIDRLAEGLRNPERFCGMHFFNPVPMMPLVEVIRGRHADEATLARTVAFALALGKMPIVVRDCPGFLVNRVLFPYFNGFNRLLQDGVDFVRIDRLMEGFGWPMGPAYLADVIGLDTMVHADRVLQEGYPERMGHDGEPLIEQLLAAGCLGQKNGMGFYLYGIDDQGRRQREPSAEARALLGTPNGEVSDQDIIDRLMIPLCLETVRCLEEGIVESAAEADMGLVLGLGFPRLRGGALRYIQNLGLAEFAARAERHVRHGGLYQLTEDFRARLQAGQRYH
ncbi:fatty acid oxidation complex subunit alpha FadB [Pseudomonas stutzeri]|uniref:fatty acid oxidation complex subunit alpha FadB n=1 Tax=Stutzerimonas stutzeri TaxID=316 RepID=UPI00190A33CE|nr:fatty acid oxidation complex subunit alpha FadB [Stutzerimonas stutzeri]MBK3869762.1 fatty acid oxidation complex subunit alpha FadB [Stutzerimonas stutzeri]